MHDVVEITDVTFEKEVLQSDKPTLVDFWAPWCMPCRMMPPILDDLMESSGGGIKVCKLNTDQNQMTAAKYGIMSIPSLVFFNDGKEIGRTIGVQPAESLKAALDKALLEAV